MKAHMKLTRREARQAELHQRAEQKQRKWQESIRSSVSYNIVMIGVVLFFLLWIKFVPPDENRLRSLNGSLFLVSLLIVLLGVAKVRIGFGQLSDPNRDTKYSWASLPLKLKILEVLTPTIGLSGMLLADLSGVLNSTFKIGSVASVALARVITAIIWKK